MKKYIATIEDRDNGNTFKLYFENGVLVADIGNGNIEEVYDMQDSTAADYEIVEIVYALYDNDCWNIADCIEYEC